MKTSPLAVVRPSAWISLITTTRPANFFGGEKQRLAFSRIFPHTPDIVVLEEATSALDPESQDRLMERLTTELAETTVVSVGHWPELEAFHSRKIVLERRRGGAKFVTDIQLIRKPRDRLIKKWLRHRRRRTA